MLRASHALIALVLLALANSQEFVELSNYENVQLQQQGRVRPIESYQPQFVRVLRRRTNANGTFEGPLLEQPRVLIDRRTNQGSPLVLSLPTYVAPPHNQPAAQQSAQDQYYLPPPDKRPRPPTTEDDIQIENNTWVLNEKLKGIRFSFSHDHSGEKDSSKNKGTVNVSWLGDRGDAGNTTWEHQESHHSRRKNKGSKEKEKGHRHHHHHHNRKGRKGRVSKNITIITVPEWSKKNQTVNLNVTYPADVEEEVENKPNVFEGILHFVKEGTALLTDALSTLTKSINRPRQQKRKVQVQYDKQYS